MNDFFRPPLLKLDYRPRSPVLAYLTSTVVPASGDQWHPQGKE
jgi:hypothetical protein